MCWQTCVTVYYVEVHVPAELKHNIISECKFSIPALWFMSICQIQCIDSFAVLIKMICQVINWSSHQREWSHIVVDVESMWCGKVVPGGYFWITVGKRSDKWINGVYMCVNINSDFACCHFALISKLSFWVCGSFLYSIRVFVWITKPFEVNGKADSGVKVMEINAVCSPLSSSLPLSCSFRPSK